MIPQIFHDRSLPDCPTWFVDLVMVGWVRGGGTEILLGGGWRERLRSSRFSAQSICVRRSRIGHVAAKASLPPPPPPPPAQVILFAVARLLLKCRHRLCNVLHVILCKSWLIYGIPAKVGLCKRTQVVPPELLYSELLPTCFPIITGPSLLSCFCT